MSFAVVKTWITNNPIKDFDRSAFIGHDADTLNSPLDVELAEVIEEVRAWHPGVARLMVWLRETGMRLDEALSIYRSDIHPCGTKATLRRGVKRNNKAGYKTRTISLDAPPTCYRSWQQKVVCFRAFGRTLTPPQASSASGSAKGLPALNALESVRLASLGSTIFATHSPLRL